MRLENSLDAAHLGRKQFVLQSSERLPLKLFSRKDKKKSEQRVITDVTILCINYVQFESQGRSDSDDLNQTG